MAHVEAACEAYGFLRAQQARFGEITRPGSQTTPAWMDIPLDSEAELAKNRIQLRPVVLKSLQDAGYHCLGDHLWVSRAELKRLYYVGIKTAREIRAVIERFEHEG